MTIGVPVASALGAAALLVAITAFIIIIRRRRLRRARGPDALKTMKQIAQRQSAIIIPTAPAGGAQSQSVFSVNRRLQSHTAADAGALDIPDAGAAATGGPVDLVEEGSELAGAIPVYDDDPAANEAIERSEICRRLSLRPSDIDPTKNYLVPPAPEEQAPVEPPAPPLPRNWQRFFDEQQQLYYYYNSVTQQSQWEMPTH
jgi:hypothetical protein